MKSPQKSNSRRAPVDHQRLVVHCCGCDSEIRARLTDGAEIYPHRSDLASLPFWKCDDCGNYVGCHYKTKDRTRPLGCIPTPKIRNARNHIHALIDPAWKSGKVKRGRIYSHLSEALGRQYHSGDLRSVDEARMIYQVAKDFLHVSVETRESKAARRGKGKDDSHE